LVGNNRTQRWTLLDIKAQPFNLFEGFLLGHTNLGIKWHEGYGENISSIVGRIFVCSRFSNMIDQVLHAKRFALEIS
jgi:hypothetical protein